MTVLLWRERYAQAGLAQRARIVLRAAEGTPNRTIAAELGVSPMTVLLWRTKYERDGLAGLADEARPGRPPTYGREERDRVIALTLEPPSDGTTHWSARRLASRVAMSETTVWRIWQTVGLKPHRTETFKYSTDPALEAKVRDVVGLYLAPPERAIVLSVDEKTGIQALDRTAPMLPLRPGQVERHTRDYTRNGTTSLFAELEVATGTATTGARARQAGADFLAFLRRVERAYPDSELYVVLDNTSSLNPAESPTNGRQPSRRSRAAEIAERATSPGRCDTNVRPSGRPDRRSTESAKEAIVTLRPDETFQVPIGASGRASRQIASTRSDTWTKSRVWLPSPWTTSVPWLDA